LKKSLKKNQSQILKNDREDEPGWHKEPAASAGSLVQGKLITKIEPLHAVGLLQSVIPLQQNENSSGYSNVIYSGGHKM
jgi:hypothetical protein